VILEAWGPDLPACCEEAVAALASVYLDTGGDEVDRRSLRLAPAADEDVLVDVLDEVIFTLDTADGVPVGAEIRAVDDGGLEVDLILADPATVAPTGAVPKAVSLSELSVRAERGCVRCRFLVDV
jgi:SHS2 domain-containing protein